MPLPVFDPKTGKAVATPDAQTDLLSGKVAVKKDQDVNVIGQDGKPVSVKGADLFAALQQGYRVESDKEAGTNKYLQDNEGLKGALKVFGAKAGSELAFGVPEQIAKKNRSQEDQERWDKLLEAHPYASGLGTAAGFAGNLLATEGLGVLGAVGKAGKLAESAVLGGKALEEASLGARMLSGAARYGTEAGLLQAPQVITEAALGDPKEAAEHLAIGVGTAGLFGAAVPMFKAAGKFALQAAGKPIGLDMTAANPLEKLTENQTFKSLMYGTDKRAVQEAETVGGEKAVSKFIHENNLLKNVGEDFGQYGERIATQKETVGEQIGSLYKNLDALGAEAAPTEEVLSKMQKEVIDPLKKLSTRKGEVTKLENYLADFRETANTIAQERAQQKAAQLAEHGATEVGIGQAANDIDSRLTLNDLWTQTKDLGNKIYQEKKAGAIGNLTPIDQQLDKFRNILLDEIKTKGEVAMKAAGEEFIKPIESLNKQYQMLSKIETIVDRSAASEMSRRNLSLSDYLAGGFSGLHTAASLATGNVAGVLTSLGSSLSHKFIRENGNALVAKYGNKLGLFMADLAKQEGEMKLAQIPNILTKITKAVPAADVTAVNALHLFLGQQDSKLKDEDAFKQVSEKIAQAANDPNAQAHVQGMTRELSKGAPGVAQAYQAQLTNSLQYLNSQLPKNPNPVAMPFASNVWAPSKKQMKEFKSTLGVYLNPYSVLDDLHKQTLTPKKVQDLKALYPSIYGKMVDGINEFGMSKKAQKMPQKYRQSIYFMTGIPTSQALGHIASTQEVFAPHEEQPKGTNIKKPVPGSNYSDIQRVQNNIRS